MKNKKMLALIMCFVTLGITLLILATSIAIVPAGHVGVHDLFGQVSSSEYSPGLHLKNPFANVVMLSTKTQEYTMSYIQGEGAKSSSDVIGALTKEGLTVNLDITVLYRLIPNEADTIYRTVGANYLDIIVRPQVRTAIRDVVATYDAKDIYSAKRQQVPLDIYDEMEQALIKRGIILESVLLRHVQIPDELTSAIEAKLTAEQMIQKKAFEVEEAKQEASRKREEARGIADANEIISNSLTPSYLKWYWIGELDKANVYYVPVGNDGLPLFKEIGEQ